MAYTGYDDDDDDDDDEPLFSDDEDDDVTLERSPIDDVDELTYFVQHLHSAMQREHDIYTNLIGELPQNVRQTLDFLGNEVEQRLAKQQGQGASSSSG
mgnify:CR=1 FL=1